MAHALDHNELGPRDEGIAQFGYKKYERRRTIHVETDRHGYEANGFHGNLSIRTSSTREVVFKEVSVVEKDLMGGKSKASTLSWNLSIAPGSRSLPSVAIESAPGALDKRMRHPGRV
jgi:alkylation response protein AidB-like acyl-CoA dehydrogenase